MLLFDGFSFWHCFAATNYDSGSGLNFFDLMFDVGLELSHGVIVIHK